MKKFSTKKTTANLIHFFYKYNKNFKKKSIYNYLKINRLLICVFFLSNFNKNFNKNYVIFLKNLQKNC